MLNNIILYTTLISTNTKYRVFWEFRFNFAKRNKMNIIEPLMASFKLAVMFGETEAKAKIGLSL
jgi:hypothetical protein